MKYDIEIPGVGRTCCKERWSRGLVDLAVESAGEALSDAGNARPTAVVASNSVGGALGDQRNLGTYIATRLGLSQVETHTVSTDEASGGTAIRLASALIESGMHEEVLVTGAEKTSDALPDELEAVRATGLDAMREAGFGFGPAVAAGMGMGRYLDHHGLDREDFYHLARTAHLAGARNPLAFFAWELSFEQYIKSPVVASPLTVCDQAPACDGGASVILRKRSAKGAQVVLSAGAQSSGTTGISEPISTLALPAAKASATQALESAGLGFKDIALFELHDSSSFMAVLSMEAVGLCEPGEALRAAKEGRLEITGATPCWTFGGLKSRGNAPGASGIYQIVEAALQLRGQAGENQVPSEPGAALVQCLGSFGATAVTHILERRGG